MNAARLLVSADDPVAWHYTVGLRFESILQDGFILPATAYVPETERPLVWLSTHTVFEPTARKLIGAPGGKPRIASLVELARLGGGLVRIGYPCRSLVPWPDIGLLARMDRKTRRLLQESASRQGANPSHWWGSLEPLALAAGVIEAMDGGGHWCPLAELAEVMV